MSHYARVFNGVVTDVIVAEQDFIDQLPDADLWIQTSYRTQGNTHPEGTPLRGNFASIGGNYNYDHDVFYDRPPYPSWRLNTTTWLWEPPVEHPQDGQFYLWDEICQAWVTTPSY